MPTAAKQRVVVFCGDIGVPEAGSAAHSHHATTTTASAGSPLGRKIALLADAAAASVSPSRSRGVPVEFTAVELLACAASGESLDSVGCDSALERCRSLDGFFALQGHSDQPVTLVKAASGDWHSLLLLSVGQALLLSPDESEHATAVTLGGGVARSDNTVQDIAAGRSHFVLCTDLGSVYTFGWSNEYGQLGDGTVWRVDEHRRGSGLHARPPALTDPRKLPNFGLPSADAAAALPGRPVIIAVAAGSDHSVLLSATRTTVFTCGRGHRGQLGTMRRVELRTAFAAIQPLVGVAFAAVAAAADHTLLLLDTGKLVALGDATTGATGTGATAALWEPKEVIFEETAAQREKEDAAAAATATKATTSAKLVPADEKSYATTATAVGKKTTTLRRPIDDKARFSMNAPYGSPESFYYPRRVFRLPTAPSVSGSPVVQAVFTSPWLTVISTSDQELYSCGLRLPLHTTVERADGLGHLARPLAQKRDARIFAPTTIRRCASAASGGWSVVCGNGFCAFLDVTTGVLRLQGTVHSHRGRPLRISSLDRKHITGFDTPQDDSIQVSVGVGRRVVAAAAVRNGLLLVLETTR